MRKLFLPLMLLLPSACGESNFYQSVNYPIYVDSITVPEVVSSNQTLTVNFFGHVGPNDCFSFLSFETEKTTAQIEVVVLGRYYSTGRCQGGDVYLAGESLDVGPPFSDPFTVTVVQPGGERLTRTVTVQ